MRIGRRLYLQFLVAILPLALLVVWLSLSRNDLPQRVNAALRAYDLSLESANAFRDFMGGVADALDTGRLGSGAVESLKRAQASAAQLAAVSPEDAALPARVAAILAPLSANPPLDAILALKEEAQALRAALLAASEAKRAALTRLVEAEEASARRRRELVLAAALGALLVMAFTAFVLRRLVRGITMPLAEAVNVANAIAAGRLDNPVVVRGGDEIAQLQAAMKAMQDNLCGIVRSVRHAAESVADASETVSAETQSLSQRSEEQAASLEEAAASMEELASAVRENSGNATEADTLARGVSGSAVTGGDSVRRVVETMRGITDSTRRIFDIVGVIDSIAFQTNILALNAAVEAARAGDQGRGFAVVAAEVRSLAQRSATAATEIKALIAESVTRIDDGGHEVEVAGTSIDALVADVKKVSELMSSIASASTQQEQGIRQVSISVTEMDRVVQQNAVAVHRSAAQGEKLKRDAHLLEDAVSRFRLPAQAEDAARPSPSIPAPAPAPARALKRLGSA